MKASRRRKMPITGRGERLTGLKTKYCVGQRVKVRFEGIRQTGINCNRGTIDAIKCRFPFSETHRTIMYHVIFDEPYFKQAMFGNLHYIWTGEDSIKAI